ncbi:Uncharacterized protein DAT39_000096, partial [Clarias magur]
PCVGHWSNTSRKPSGSGMGAPGGNFMYQWECIPRPSHGATPPHFQDTYNSLTGFERLPQTAVGH